MNIEQAKEDIRKTILAYTAKTEAGTYRIPFMRQRPILLMGPPGIGKTAIMAQLAAQCGVGLVSYTMTHHTRQSAIGLPMIAEESFQGTAFSVTRYTMSEIIASVRRQMEQTGLNEGILFLDEINCISETLLPAILQLLQYKSFGSHRLPEGWVIVAAGNQPRYNQSAKEFDTAILDRMKVLEIEPDLTAWKPYAVNQGIHASILAYLTMNPEDFYAVQAGKHGRSFVTARGWEDLSDMLTTLEELKLPVEDSLFREYLQHEEIAERFALFYRLSLTYRAKKPLDTLRQAAFDERLCVILFMAGSLQQQARKIAREQALINSIRYLLENASSVCQASSPETASNVRLASASSETASNLRLASASPETASNVRLTSASPETAENSLRLPGVLDDLLLRRKDALAVRKNAGLLSAPEEEQELLLEKQVRALLRSSLRPSPTDSLLITEMENQLARRTGQLDDSRKTLLAAVRTDLSFIQSALGEGQELFIFSTELYEHRELHELIRRFDQSTDAVLRARLDLQTLKARLS